MDTEERTERMVRQIDTLVASPKIPTDLKHFVLDEFVGKMVSTSVYITKRRCHMDDELEFSLRADPLIAALAPFLHSAIMKEEKVRRLSELIAYITPRLESVTESRRKLARDEAGVQVSTCQHLQSDKELLRRAIKRAQENGWEGGDRFLALIDDLEESDAAYVLRELLKNSYFVEMFWQEENLEKHRLALQLVEDPLTYVRLYV